MNFRELGKLDLKTSEIGFGAWAIGGDAWGPVEDRNSVAAMERAIEVGMNYSLDKGRFNGASSRSPTRSRL